MRASFSGASGPAVAVSLMRWSLPYRALGACSDAGKVGEVLAPRRPLVLAEVADPGLGEPDQVARVEPHAVAVVAGSEHDVIAVEQPHVDGLGQRQRRADGRQRAGIERRELLRHLLLGG